MDTGGSSNPKPPGTLKGTHGGRRQGAGRPKKSVTFGVTPTPPERQNSRVTTPSSQTASTSSQRPAAPFFLPRNTNRGIPLGNFPQRASLWSATGTSHAADSSASVPAVTPVSSPQQLSESDVARLNEELAYIDENDEHADTAAGDRIIDESLTRKSQLRSLLSQSIWCQ
ncbi:hypothetical protein B0H11DRAFT_1919654 [Mycena galericulata]|nr:hypothetical protein B0H11DRAFT_1919654 [Mycena galericulata]